MSLKNTWNTGETFAATDANAVATAVNTLTAVSTSSAASLTLTSAYATYVYTGSAASTWTLPAVSGNAGITVALCNRGSGLLTVQRAGSDSMYNQGATVTSIPLAPGASLTLVDDGTYWLVRSAYLPHPVYDNSAQTAYQSSLASGTVVPFSQAVAANNPYGLVCISGVGTMTLAATASVTFGGVTLSSLGGVYNANDTSGASGWLWVFGGPAIPGGASQTGSVTLTQSGKTWSGYVLSFTYPNVTSVGPLQTAYGSGTATSISVAPTTSSPSIVWSAHSMDAWESLPTYSMQNLRQSNTTAGTPDFVVGDSSVATTSTVTATTQWSGGNAYWCAAGLNLS